MSKRFKAGSGFGTRYNPIVIDGPSRARKTRVVAITTKAPRRAGFSKLTPSFNRQLKALIASKKRDAADVTRSDTDLTSTSIACLTSSTDFATAASGTGLLDGDADEMMINNVRIKGSFLNPAKLDLDPTGNADVVVRALVVWFNKPLLVASAAGTLPPITEVLVTDSVYSLPVTDAANGGRFKILSDKRFNLGSNTFQAATAVGHARVSGQTNHMVDYKVKVNRMCRFKSSSTSGSNAGGHYDSDVSPGQVDRGLLVMYTMSNSVGEATTPQSLLYTRLNYTG